MDKIEPKPEEINPIEPVAEITIRSARDEFQSLKNTKNYTDLISVPTELVTTKDRVVADYLERVKASITAVEIAQKAYINKKAELDDYYETEIKPFRDALELAISDADEVVV